MNANSWAVQLPAQSSPLAGKDGAGKKINGMTCVIVSHSASPCEAWRGVKTAGWDEGASQGLGPQNRAIKIDDALQLFRRIEEPDAVRRLTRRDLRQVEGGNPAQSGVVCMTFFLIFCVDITHPIVFARA